MKTLKYIFLTAALTGLSFGAKAQIASGTCGNSLTWRLYVTSGDTTLVILGNGEMTHYTYSSLPTWDTYRSQIRRIEIRTGVTTIGNYAFYNFSRMILGWKVATEYKSSVMLENLRNVYYKYFLEKEDPLAILLVDDGIENKGAVNVAIATKKVRFIKWVAQKDIHFSNSIVEVVNKLMKYDFLFRQELLDFDHVQRYLETAVETYNNRPHYTLLGLTPYEVFHGQVPDKNLFKEQEEQAKILRIAENKALACDNCAFLIENNE